MSKVQNYLFFENEPLLKFQDQNQLNTNQAVLNSTIFDPSFLKYRQLQVSISFFFEVRSSQNGSGRHSGQILLSLPYKCNTLQTTEILVFKEPLSFMKVEL